MCLPPVVAGIATFASSAIGSIASHSQEQAAYKAQMEAYRRSEQAYNSQIRLNQEAANRGYVSEQNKLQGEFMKASQEAQQRLVTSLQSQGSVLASGRSGQSIGLLLSDAERGYGRDLANIAQNLAFARQDYATGAESLYLNQESANNVAASNRMLQPSKPSKIGLITGLAQGAISGVTTASSLKAPKGKSPSGIPGAQLPGGRAGTVIRWS